jgi:hypothetical protein
MPRIGSPQHALGRMCPGTEADGYQSFHLEQVYVVETMTA